MRRPPKVPMIIAINKMDTRKPNPDKVRTDLLQHEVIVEEDVRRRAGRRGFGMKGTGWTSCWKRFHCSPRFWS